MPRKVQASDLQPANGVKSRGIKKKKKVVDDTTLFASYLPKLCNAVFQSDSGVTMSGKTCRSLSALLGSLEDVLTSDAKRISEFQQKKSILPVSVQVALATRLPRALTELAAREGSDAVHTFQKNAKSAGGAKKKNGLTAHP